MVTEIRCSGLARVMNCLGFVSMKDLEIAPEGQPAKDGTAVGELLSHMINQNTVTPNVPNRYASNGVMWDNDMWFYAKDTYETILKTAQGNPITTEQRIDWMTPSGILIRGSYDIRFKVGSTLHIEDLKYGWLIVEVKKNWQLLGYAIGEYMRLHQLGQAGDITQISLTIHQPRPYHQDGRVRTWVITVEELFNYYNEICERMQRLVNGDQTLSTNKYCRYCDAANNCPALNTTVYKCVDTVMTEWKQDVMSNEDIAKELVLLERVKELLKLKYDSLEQLAIMRMQKNEVVPGFAYEMTYGDRKWKPEVTAKAIEILTGKNIVKAPELLSPNQAEKLGLNKKLTAHLTYKPGAGAKIVKKDRTDEARKVFTKPEEV